MRNKPSLLIIAPGACKDEVGEVYLAYQWIKHLTRFFTVTVLTIDRQNGRNLKPTDLDAEIVSFKEASYFYRHERFNSIVKPWYPKFYWEARNWLIQAGRRGQVNDWHHHLTPFAMRYPSPLAGLNLKYSVGPVAGSLKTPDAFINEDTNPPWYMPFRHLDRIRFRFDPFLRRSYQQAELVFAATEYARNILTSDMNVSPKNICIFNEHGVENVYSRGPEHTDHVKILPIKLLYVGRVIRTKGLRDLIRAISHLPENINIHLDAVGDGPDLAACITEARDLGVYAKITFHGKLQRNSIDKFYRDADIFVFPSFREPTGGVVIEAMSFGLPLIVADYGGPSSIVKESFGDRIAISEPHQFAKDIASSIARLVQDPDKRAKMGLTAKLYCAEHYLWETKISRVADLIDQTADRLV